MYKAHSNLLEKLDLLSKTDFSKFSDCAQFDKINNELKSFYSLMKNENKHEILLDINVIQQMFVNIVLTNKYKGSDL